MADESDGLESVRASILAAALPNVPFDGWSVALLRNAADEAIDDARYRSERDLYTALCRVTACGGWLCVAFRQPDG